MQETAALLGELGPPDLRSHELHAPMTIDKTKTLRALDLGSRLDVVHKRTMYGNLAHSEVGRSG